MKKSLFVIALTFVIAFSADAQKFKAGLILGVAGTQVSGDNLGGFDKAGIAAGGMVSTPLSEKFDIAFEILYFQKGSRKNIKPDNEDYTSYLLRLNYFEVPIMLQWKYSKRFMFEAGPTFGALLSSLEEDQFGEIPESREFNKYEVGIAGGMKIHFAKNFSSTLRIASSVLPVRKHASQETYQLNRGQYNAAILFALQYTFKKNNE